MKGIKALSEAENAARARAERTARARRELVAMLENRSLSQAPISKKGVKIMTLFKTFTITELERGILFRRGAFVRVLEPGNFRFWDPRSELEVQSFNLAAPEFKNTLRDYFLRERPEIVERHFVKVETLDLEIAVVRRDGGVLQILGPRETVLFWKAFIPLEVEKLRVDGGLTLAREHDLLGKKNEAWLRGRFTDVNPGENAFALVELEGKLSHLILPGERKLYWDGLERVKATVVAVSANVPKDLQTVLVARHTDWLERKESARDPIFLYADLGEYELALVRRGKAIVSLVTPTQSALYLNDGVNALEVLSVLESFEVRSDVAVALRGSPLGTNIEYVEVPEYHVGALYVDGKLSKTLEPGTHAFWKVTRKLRTVVTETRLQTLEVSGQEILTKDKVSLRLNLTAGYRVSDALLAFSKLADFGEYLYKELQFALRSSVGTRTLDELLEDKTALDGVILTQVRARLENLGLELESVGIKDIILPGEMKALLSKVVEAEKAAQANGIRRREETAATRSLLNTAKVMEDNPVALRLKELETLERVTKRVGSLTVHSGLEGVLSDLVKIRR